MGSEPALRNPNTCGEASVSTLQGGDCCVMSRPCDVLLVMFHESMLPLPTHIIIETLIEKRIF
jgi:hypothetical protein